jgi:hypothetical protein
MPFDHALDGLLANVRTLSRVERRLEHEKRQLKDALLGEKLVEDLPLCAVMRRMEDRLEQEKRQLKGALLNGRQAEDGSLVAVLELLPGRNPQSKNPDDYEVTIRDKN